MTTPESCRRTVELLSAAIGDFRARRSGFAVALCLTGWIAVSDRATAQSVTSPCPQTGASWGSPPSGLPVDVCYPNTQRSDFNALSWQIFKFLVWPASSKQRGEADTSRKVTDMRGPRTFETLKADWETFLPNAFPPSPWEAYPRVAWPCTNQPKIKPRDLVLASRSEFGNFDNLREVDNTPGLTNLLVAQNWTYVRYLAAYNKEVFKTIVSNKLYNPANVPAIDPHSPVPPAAIEPHGAMTVKSAWIELPKGNDPSGKHLDPSRFYVRRDAWLQDPQTGDCRAATVGLVGLHIVFKTQSRPQWIWSTFEHVDNVPEQGEPSGKPYTFNNGDGTHMTDDPEPMYLFPRPPGAPKPSVPPKPFQVERLQKISEDTLKANGDSQAQLGRLGSVWRYYKLVMTQWPAIPFAPKDDATQALPMPYCSERGANAAINTTMETFLQTKQCDPRDPPKLTCMGCHNTARSTDFIWSIPINAKFPTDSYPIRTPRDEALKALQDILHGSQP
jgi:hypothetical protein